MNTTTSLFSAIPLFATLLATVNASAADITVEYAGQITSAGNSALIGQNYTAQFIFDPATADYNSNVSGNGAFIGGGTTFNSSSTFTETVKILLNGKDFSTTAWTYSNQNYLYARSSGLNAGYGISTTTSDSSGNSVTASIVQLSNTTTYNIPAAFANQSFSNQASYTPSPTDTTSFQFFLGSTSLAGNITSLIMNPALTPVPEPMIGTLMLFGMPFVFWSLRNKKPVAAYTAYA